MFSENHQLVLRISLLTHQSAITEMYRTSYLSIGSVRSSKPPLRPVLSGSVAVIEELGPFVALWTGSPKVAGETVFCSQTRTEFCRLPQAHFVLHSSPSLEKFLHKATKEKRFSKRQTPTPKPHPSLLLTTILNPQPNRHHTDPQHWVEHAEQTYNNRSALR